MNNTPNSGGRKKKVTEGNGKIGKRKPAQTSGPVGREDGYSGRKDQENNVGSPHGEGSNEERAGLGDLIGGLSGLAGSSSGGQSSGNQGSLLGSLLGGSSGGSSSGNQSSGNQGSLLGSLLGGSSGGGNSGNQSSGSSGGRGGLGKLLPLLLVLVIGFILYKSCIGGKGCNMINFSDSIAQGFNQYQEDDYVAPTANSASTSVSTPDLTVNTAAREKFTKLKGDGTDTVTVMVYMCGTDLESKYGMATNDLNEMLHASFDSKKVRVIVETGGTKQWKNSVMSNSTNQRWQITSQGLLALDKNVGMKSMTKPETLTDFIKFCKDNYPADRYMLIFWDHGGGSLSGYGYDQNFSGSMTLDKINKALYDGGVKFDFIGFDACLMATMENALVCQQYADYLIASEETEPGCGWYYTRWLKELSDNTAINTVTLAKTIIDDFNDVCKKNNAGDSTTLSIVDLAEFQSTVPADFKKFANNVSTLLDGDQYQVVASARSGAREFGASAGINHVDLIHLAKGVGTSEANAFVNTLQKCIKYNRTSKSMTNAYGMSIYFPYTSFSSVNSAVNLYNAIGMDASYSACVKSFASLAAGGQIATGAASSPLGSLFGGMTGNTSSTSSSDMLGSLLGGLLGGGSGGGSGDLLSSILGGRSMPDDQWYEENKSWFDPEKIVANGDYYDSHVIYADDMIPIVKGDKSVLSLSKEKWDIVENIQINVFYDDGEGYIDLGMDNVYQFDADGDLVIDYDRTWLSLDGQIVPYYMISNVQDGDSYVITGRVPAYLNGDYDHVAYVIVVFDNETALNEYGYVAGVRYNYKDETDTLGRGLIKLKKGDKLEFICDYYSYDGEYQQSYLFGEPFIVNGDIDVANVEIDDGVCRVTYCISDIYNNEFWTQAKDF